MTTKHLELGLIRTDGGTQMRAELNRETVVDYRDQMSADATFPALDVFYDGAEYWLADGFHRFFAAKEAKLEAIEVTIRQGTQRDAQMFAAGSNKGHGLRRSNADKRKAVEWFLNDEECVKWSDRKIADEAGVSTNFVGDVRRELSSDDSSPAAQAASAPRVGRDGKSRKPPKQIAAKNNNGTPPKEDKRTSFNVAEIEGPPTYNFEPHLKALEKLMRFADDIKSTHGRIAEYIAVETHYRKLHAALKALEARV